tara:strand:+ start:81770 stop:81976 length:207 start_codon:yes stop_codon:yes gene_type:complete
MTTYKERQENLEYFVLLEYCNVLGTFGNLKKVCDFLDGKDFYSYNTIVRKKTYPVTYKNYKVFKVKHY